MKWKVIHSLIISLFIFGSNVLFASSQNFESRVDLSLDHNPEVIEKMIEPLWTQIPYVYRWKGKKLGQDDKTIQLEIVHAKVSLGKKNQKLVTVNPIANNLLDLNWHLGNLMVDGLVRVKFQYEKFGVKISHTEHFNIDGQRIYNANSRVNLVFNQGQINLDIDYNKNFKFNKIIVAPKDGVGKTLRWIFDNVFSKGEVDRYINEKINEELRDWVNSNELISNIEKQVNDNLQKFQNMKIKIGDLTSEMIIALKEFAIDEKMFNIGASIDFDISNKSVHVCAENLVDDFKRRKSQAILERGDIGISHPLIEQALINYSSFETKDQNGDLIQPLFCFGYQEFDDKGMPLGEKANIDLGVGSVNFKYWVKPELAPVFKYDADNNNISVWMKFGIDIQGEGIPKVRVKDGPIFAEVQAKFSPNHVLGKGLVLNFVGLEIMDISGGDLQVKWFPLLPFVTIDVQKYQGKLEGILNKEIRKSLDNGTLGIIDDRIELTKALNLELKGHQMSETGHKIEFDLIAE